MLNGLKRMGKIALRAKALFVIGITNPGINAGAKHSPPKAGFSPKASPQAAFQYSTLSHK